ncbi:hypothetical protein ACWKWA_03575 [Dermacoccus abyssi]
MIQSIVWGAVIALALRWLYRYLSVEWPERYADPEDLVSIVVSRSWWTYILFRLGPVAMAGILAVHGAQQLEWPSAVALLAMCLTHVLTSSVAAMVTMSKNEWARTTRMYFHGITAVGVVLSCALVWATRRWTGWLAPDVRGLSTNIWATVLALALAKGAYDLLKRAPEAEYLHDRAARSVDPELLVKIRSADCSHTGALEAIALAEAVERPRWFRRLERCVPGVESTGVMQVKHNGVLTDEESVELFLAKHNEVCEQLANEGATAETIFRRHNNDDNFVAMCRRLQPQW